MKNYLKILCLLPSLLFINELRAEIVSLEISPGIIANADYRSGEPEKPLLIFIHGFLQTREFSTVRRLADAMSDSGFSVLSPTLSLGISNRAQSLPCESVHLHSLSGDTKEIAQWVSWGHQRGHEEVILIGHSAGSINITAFLLENPSKVSKTLLLSLYHLSPGRPEGHETDEHARLAREMLAQGNHGLAKFAYSYCQEYVSTAENFLSYFDWDKPKIIKAISNQLTENYVIIGSSDDRISNEWIESLKKTQAKVIVIEGANHFFDESHEFDLLDEVENILSIE